MVDVHAIQHTRSAVAVLGEITLGILAPALCTLTRHHDPVHLPGGPSPLTMCRRCYHELRR